jgi:hypothetical protein
MVKAATKIFLVKLRQWLKKFKNLQLLAGI